jgi:alpha-L-rhamnosidase
MASAESPRAVGTEDFPEIRWRGNWVWVPEEPVVPSGGFAAAIDPEAREANGLFRRVFTLDRVPERVPARITADSRYVLHVNGCEVGRGPIRSQFRRLQYDMYDLAPYLVVGQNVIAVHVKYYGRETAFWMPATPNRTLGRTGALVFECDLGAAGWLPSGWLPAGGLPSGWLVSDETWKARRADAWDHPEADGREMAAAGVPLEIFDARLLPPDWKSAAFDDAGWGQAQVIHAMLSGTYRSQPPTHPYGPLYPRSIGRLGGDVVAPARIEVTALPGHAVRLGASPMDRVDDALAAARAAGPREGRLPAGFDVPASGAVWVAIDMGRIVSGFVHLAVEAAPGTEFDLSYTEEPIRVGPTFGRMRAGSRYIARDDDDHFDLFDAIGFRYAYLLVHGEPHRSVLREFAVREYLHPWRDIATFACSDPRLEEVFRAGLRTVQLCSPDAFVDCPTREQRAWTGDGVVHQMATLAANSDWRLAQRYVELGNSPRSDGILPMFTVSLLELTGGFTLPDWSLHWVHGVHNWFRYAGDRGAVLSWMPTVARILRWYAPYQTATGVLKDVGEWNLVDWSSVSTSDTSSLLTAEWARGLREFAEMAAWLGENGSRQWAEDLYERVKAGFEVFWDESRGSYIDHIVDGVPQPEMSQIAGALAIVSGLAPESRWPRIVDTITDEKRLVVRSWSGGGQSEEKFEKMQRGIYEFDWDVRNEIVMSQPFMSYVVHDAVALAGRADLLPDLHLRWLGFLEDGYDTIGENWGLGTHAHGWSCTPARDLLVYTLGVSPAEPGFTRARIAPRPGRLEWVRGEVPTPCGRLWVEMAGNRLTIDSPMAFKLCLHGLPPVDYCAGRHTIEMANANETKGHDD